MPKRIQRQRTKGWRMSEGAIYVGRPTRWGNPFRPDGPEDLGLRLSVDLFRDLVAGTWNPMKLSHLGDQSYQRIYEAAQVWRKRIGRHPVEAARAELRGHDLVCWCPPGQYCHATVLLEVANS